MILNVRRNKDSEKNPSPWRDLNWNFFRVFISPYNFVCCTCWDIRVYSSSKTNRKTFGWIGQSRSLFLTWFLKTMWRPCIYYYYYYYLFQLSDIHLMVSWRTVLNLFHAKVNYLRSQAVPRITANNHCNAGTGFFRYQRVHGVKWRLQSQMRQYCRRLQMWMSRPGTEFSIG